MSATKKKIVDELQGQAELVSTDQLQARSLWLKGMIERQAEYLDLLKVEKAVCDLIINKRERTRAIVEHWTPQKARRT